MSWIDVSDRLPEKNGMYFVTYSAVGVEHHFTALCAYAEKEWVLPQETGDLKILYWMEMPPPKYKLKNEKESHKN